MDSRFGTNPCKLNKARTMKTALFACLFALQYYFISSVSPTRSLVPVFL